MDLETGKARCGYFQVSVVAKYNSDYWLMIEISENATLKDLDYFIRDIWVECCGHLSAFEIDGIQYEAYPCTTYFWDEPPKSMNHKLKNVFTVGQTATYEYDFGSTTELILRVHNYRIGARKKEKITILSRNNPLEILCSKCQKNKAQWIDSMRIYEEDPFWCEECLREMHRGEEDLDEDDEIPEYFLPVCNSPRMGVCAYEGSSAYPDQFQPDEDQGTKEKKK